MARPRTDEIDPQRRLLRAWKAGEDVEPGVQEHLVGLAREAVREGEDFSIFEKVAAAMALRLYARSLASQDAITCARALGEVVRGLRAVGLVGTAACMKRGGGQRRAPMWQERVSNDEPVGAGEDHEDDDAA